MDIGITDTDASLRIFVVGGKEVPKKYKAELRVFSNSKNICVTYNGPVFPVDDPDQTDPDGT